LEIIEFKPHLSSLTRNETARPQNLEGFGEILTHFNPPGDRPEDVEDRLLLKLHSMAADYFCQPMEGPTWIREISVDIATENDKLIFKTL
jgi:hypothetical protein